MFPATRQFNDGLLGALQARPRQKVLIELTKSDRTGARPPSVPDTRGDGTLKCTPGGLNQSFVPR
jgi:hypothetical protein